MPYLLFHIENVFAFFLVGIFAEKMFLTQSLTGLLQLSPLRQLLVGQCSQLEYLKTKTTFVPSSLNNKFRKGALIRLHPYNYSVRNIPTNPRSFPGEPGCCISSASSEVDIEELFTTVKKTLDVDAEIIKLACPLVGILFKEGWLKLFCMESFWLGCSD